MDPKTLADLTAGQAATVVSIVGSDSTSARLLEMGLTPGVQLRFLRTALLGDPIEIEVRGFRMSIRRADAARIQVTPANS